MTRSGFLRGETLLDRLKPHRLLWMKYAKPHIKPLNMAWGIVEPGDPGRLNGDFVRDERLQADEVIDMLRILGDCGVDGAFVFTFAAPALPHREGDPRRDLDMASYAAVRSYDDGHWEPKHLYHALAEHYAHFIG